MFRCLTALFFAFLPGLVAAAPVEPVIPCGRQVYAFGGSTILAAGVNAPGSTDFVSRMETFFQRVCGADVKFVAVAEESGKLLDEVDAIVRQLASSPRSVAFLHFPLTDIGSGASVDQMLDAYRRIFKTCAATGSICIIGGQQPVNSFTQQQTDRQLDLERRASSAFGAHFLPLYRYFESESNTRRLIHTLDSGDGLHIGDFGHELLYKLYRRRIIELSDSAGSR